MRMPRKFVLNRFPLPIEVLKDKATVTDFTTETNRETFVPRIKDFEEDISRYGQMALWLDRMATQSKLDKPLSRRMRALSVLAVKEFGNLMTEKMEAYEAIVNDTEADTELSMAAERTKKIVDQQTDLWMTEMAA